jgi:uncharacterized membrane protein HdeD (DUF308 family)
MNQRPRSITIISWLFIIFGSIALLSGVLPFGDITFSQRVAELKSHWYVHLSRLLQIVAGVFMLYGRDWARWLLVGWIAFHIVVGALHGWVMLLMHVVIFSVILFFVFRRPAAEFFRPHSSA